MGSVTVVTRLRTVPRLRRPNPERIQRGFRLKALFPLGPSPCRNVPLTLAFLMQAWHNKRERKLPSCGYRTGGLAALPLLTEGDPAERRWFLRRNHLLFGGGYFLGFFGSTNTRNHGIIQRVQCIRIAFFPDARFRVAAGSPQRLFVGKASGRTAFHHP